MGVGALVVKKLVFRLQCALVSHALMAPLFKTEPRVRALAGEQGGCARPPASFSPAFSSFHCCVCVSAFPDGPASQAQQLPNSQALWPDDAVLLRKKKRHSRPDPFARLSDLCHRQLPEDQTAILSSMDHDDPGHATLL